MCQFVSQDGALWAHCGPAAAAGGCRGGGAVGRTVGDIYYISRKMIVRVYVCVYVCVSVCVCLYDHYRNPSG